MIRKAETKDLESVLGLFDEARTIMRADGNMDQWNEGYPGAPEFLRDVRNGVGRVVVHEGEVCGYFAFVPSPEPTYSYIAGAWVEDASPYYVIHRIASSRSSHGVFGEIIGYAGANCGNIRIDTHRDNRIMRHVIDKAGFTYCGIIYLADGAERLAYQKLL